MIRKLFGKIPCYFDSHYWILSETLYTLNDERYHNPYWHCKYCGHQTSCLSVPSKVREIPHYYNLLFYLRLDSQIPVTIPFPTFISALEYAQLWNWERGYSIRIVRNGKSRTIYDVDYLKGQKVIWDKRNEWSSDYD